METNIQMCPSYCHITDGAVCADMYTVFSLHNTSILQSVPPHRVDVLAHKLESDRFISPGFPQYTRWSIPLGDSDNNSLCLLLVSDE